MIDSDGLQVVAEPLPPSGRFQLRYVHSYYRAPAAEEFVIDPRAGFALEAVVSTNEAVLDYYGLACRRTRDGRWWRLELDEPARFEELRLIATSTGKRTLVTGDRSIPLYPANGAAAHLRIGVRHPGISHLLRGRR